MLRPLVRVWEVGPLGVVIPAGLRHYTHAKSEEFKVTDNHLAVFAFWIVLNYFPASTNLWHDLHSGIRLSWDRRKSGESFTATMW